MARKRDYRKEKGDNKPGRKEKRREDQSQGGGYMNFTDFLFESVYQIVTWVVIGLSIAGIAVFYSQQRWRLVMWAVAIMLCAIVVMIGIIADRAFFHPKDSRKPETGGHADRAASEPFLIVWQTGLIDVTEKGKLPALLFLTNSIHGKTVCPVAAASLVRIINLQEKPVTIDSFFVEMKGDDGQWIKLVIVDGRFGQLLFTRRGKKGSETDYSILSTDGADLTAMLANKAIQPHQPVAGWLFLDVPEDVRLSKDFRMRIRDAEGREYTQQIKSNAASDEDTLPGGYLRPAGRVDIHGSTFLKYAELKNLSKPKDTSKPN